MEKHVGKQTGSFLDAVASLAPTPIHITDIKREITTIIQKITSMNRAHFHPSFLQLVSVGQISKHLKGCSGPVCLFVDKLVRK